MPNILHNNKGVVLITTYFVVVVLLGLSAVIFMRTVNENRLAQKSSDSLQAFYEAEAGLAYAYAEAKAQSFKWYTHVDKDRVVNENNLADFRDEVGQDVFDDMGLTTGYTTPITMPNVEPIGPATNYCYRVQGRNFSVKAYPELSSNNERTRNLIILSQATVNGTTHIIENRITQESAYQYFFFFPETHEFGTAIFDGRGFGSIHTNGNVELTGDPTTLAYLVAFTSGSNIPEEGYMLRPWKSYKMYNYETEGYEYVRGFDDLRYENRDAFGEAPYNTILGDTDDLPLYMRTNDNYHRQRGDVIIITGPVDNPNPEITLNDYLIGPDAYWEDDKYIGDPGDANDNLPLHFVIGDEDLTIQALKELAGNPGTVSLLNASEESEFIQLFNDPGATQQQWDNFWNTWRADRANAASYTDGKNWERYYYSAVYDWSDIETPTYINMEWWQSEGLVYGADRPELTNDLAAAYVLDDATGQPIPNQFYLNTRYQGSGPNNPWADFLSDPNGDGDDADRLNEQRENGTLIQDKSQAAGGDNYVDPGGIISPHTDDDRVMQKALNGGIYIGPDPANPGEYLDPFAGSSVTEEIEFYNAHLTARDPVTGQYIPSKTLAININELINWLPENRPNFNNILYVNLADRTGLEGADPTAMGVLLEEGPRLPVGGLSVYVPKNIVYIQGNYNLNTAEDPELNLEPDPTEVLDWVVANKDYINSAEDLIWQPAEIIANAVYTLSEAFPRPQTMPLLSGLNSGLYLQGLDEAYGNTDPSVIIVADERWGTYGAAWMPEDGDVSWSPEWINWVNLETQAGNPVTPVWTPAWIEGTLGTWPENEVLSYDTNGDGNDTFINTKDLKQALYDELNARYLSYYAYGNPENTSGYAMANPVTEPHFYNTAIVTPSSTDAYVLENWSGTSRTIKGAFIQLPDEYQTPLPESSYYSGYRYSEPAKTFTYETRFGPGATGASTPATNLTFGTDASWRLVKDFGLSRIGSGPPGSTTVDAASAGAE